MPESAQPKQVPVGPAQPASLVESSPIQSNPIQASPRPVGSAKATPEPVRTRTLPSLPYTRLVVALESMQSSAQAGNLLAC